MDTVNKEQKMNSHGQKGSWIHGDLWGGRTDDWIHIAYLDYLLLYIFLLIEIILFKTKLTLIFYCRHINQRFILKAVS